MKISSHKQFQSKIVWSRPAEFELGEFFVARFQNMFKIDKHTHLIILFTFALVFVVIYLYFTITDVRKMQRDITKLAADVAALQPQQQQQPKVAGGSPTLPVPTVVQVQHAKVPQPEIIQVPAQVVEEEIITVEDEDDDYEEDVESVVTEDIKAVLTPCEEGEEEEAAEEPVVPEIVETHQSEEVVTEQLLQTLKFEEIKDMCRKRGIKIQGTKEALMKRLLESESA
jgi:hypothetical protein